MGSYRTQSAHSRGAYERTYGVADGVKFCANGDEGANDCALCCNVVVGFQM